MNASVSGDTLAAALERHGVEVDDAQRELLDRYCQALWDWNTKLNLTRHTDYEKFVARDVVDCSQLERLVDSGERVLDVGSGGGVPGAVLAILRPDLELTLTESMAKKAKALDAIVKTARIEAQVRHARAETLLAERDYDVIVVRAVAPLTKLLTWFGPHWDSFQRLLIFKGPAWIDERHAAREQGLLRGLELRKAVSYPLAGSNAESVILSVQAKSLE
jgi:16S rRNA (guanine527-N7)-methyltransferase